jgi:hypothetical protein
LATRLLRFTQDYGFPISIKTQGAALDQRGPFRLRQLRQGLTPQMSGFSAIRVI